MPDIVWIHISRTIVLGTEYLQFVSLKEFGKAFPGLCKGLVAIQIPVFQILLIAL